MKVVRCSQCGDPIFPGELYVGKEGFLFSTAGPMHEECLPLWELDEDRANFWFEYLTPKENSEDEDQDQDISRI